MSTKIRLVLATLGVIGLIVCCILELPQEMGYLCLCVYFVNAYILIVNSLDW